MILPPYLSDYDPETNSEGSLDPLGLYLIADRLAIKLVPGFRERMSHPRFLTAIAFGTHVCSIYDEDVVAIDEMTPPYLVLEWQIVQAFVSQFKETGETSGLPGVNKAMSSYKQGLPLSAGRYLKTPNVFGFNGVYRTLARDINLINEIGLGETGDKLLTIWEKEQGLEGFYTNNNGPGKKLLNDLRNAVSDGLKTGTAVNGWWWGTNKIIAEHLATYRIGQQEKEVLLAAFLDQEKPMRREVLHFLMSQEGIETWQKNFSEKEFHDALQINASQELSQLLEAIRSYEHFSRLQQNVFDEILFYLSSNGSAYIPDMVKIESLTRASSEIPVIFNQVSEKLSHFGLSHEFEESFSLFSERCSPKDWLERIIQHHFNIQKAKSTQGKRPWFERTDGGRLIIYPNYLRDKGPASEVEYVHAYRTYPLWSFIKDLKIAGE